MPAKQAAVEATKEIALAVMATTLSLVIVFVPIAFMSGYAKRYLNQFGWTMAISILVSMLVAFTLTPSLSARLLKRKHGRGHDEHTPVEESGWMQRGYVRTLGWALDHRWVIVAVCLATFGSTFVIYQHIGRDWMPQ
jgi:HAE1 family hydrophobic/amphiphilic exporter-1